MVVLSVLFLPPSKSWLRAALALQDYTLGSDVRNENDLMCGGDSGQRSLWPPIQRLLDQLDCHGKGFTAANAQRGDAALFAILL